MIVNSLGYKKSQQQMASLLGTTTNGTNAGNGVANALNNAIKGSRYKFRWEWHTYNQVDKMKGHVVEALSYGNPVMVNTAESPGDVYLKQNIADGYPMYYTFDNAKIYPNSSGEHNVIGTGYQLTSDGTDIAYIYYIDPSYRQQDSIYGGLKKITPQELFTAMLTCVEPNYG